MLVMLIKHSKWIFQILLTENLLLKRIQLRIPQALPGISTLAAQLAHAPLELAIDILQADTAGHVCRDARTVLL